MSKTRQTILIVDDDPAILKILFDYLKGAGYKVLVATHGEAALQVFDRVSPDIILLDILLPDIDGFEVAARLKANPDTREIPIMFLTALTEAVDRVKGFKMGAVDYITKPIFVEEVAARVNTHLTICNLQKELEKQNTQMQKEIAERQRAEGQIKEALKEKELLLKEIHHRVKNNLQTISSLLSLQSGYIEDKQALDVFRNSQERIRAMALIHENLYQSSDLSRIDFREYSHGLISHLYNTYSLQPGQVQLEIQVEDIYLNVDTCIPLGLLINELVSNSLKHAFRGERRGTLWVRLEKSGDEEYDYKLVVGDNGIGFPPSLDFKKSDSLGMILVNMLAKQLHGTIDLDREKGTRFIIRFKQLRTKKSK